MKKFFFIILFSTNLFCTEYLKGILLDKDKNFVKEFENIKGFDSTIFNIKAGFILYYPDGMPPICYSFQESSFEKVYEAGNLKEINYRAKDCEFMEEIKGVLKFIPEKPFKDFPFEKKYNFILYKEAEFLYLREGKYFIEEEKGLYFSPNPVNPEEFSGKILYPSFKTKILITDGTGQTLENCKTNIEFESQPFGKLCEKIKGKNFVSGNGFYQIFPIEAEIKFKVYCPSAPPVSLYMNSKEITNPLIINLKSLGSIEGYIIDEDENPVSSYFLNLFRDGEIFPLKSTKTDKDGYFKFSNLEDGLYKIKDCETQQPNKGKNFVLRVRENLAFRGSYDNLNLFVMDEPVGYYVNEVVDLKGGEKVSLNLTLPSSRAWEGIVLNSSGEPINGAIISSMGKFLSSSNEKGEFRINFRGKVLKEVQISAPEYESLYFDELPIEDAPEKIVLKGKGTFKVAFYIEDPKNQKFLTKIMEFLKFITPQGEVFGETKFNFEGGTAYIKSKLEEGEYQFKIEGGPFKPFISDTFFIEKEKEFDYGMVKIEIEKTGEDKLQKEVVIKFKDWMNHPAPDTKVIIMARPFEDPYNTFTQMAMTDREGKVVFKPMVENFLFVFIYAEGERGFLKMDMEEVADLSNLISFELKLNPPNELSIKISSVKPKEGKFKLIIKSKYNQIIEDIYQGEEKIFKNIFSPVEIEIYDGEMVIWKETLELKAGKNELIL